MSLCWRPLLLALADIVPIGWIAGPRHVPAWLEGTKIRVIRSEAKSPAVALFSCANPHHEALEAVRWARSLLASGTARPEEIAITAASPADFDDHVMALAGDANPAHSFRARREGRHLSRRTNGWSPCGSAVKGISQERVRRLFALLHGTSKAINRSAAGIHVCCQWMPRSQHWNDGEKVFAQAGGDWPEDVFRSVLCWIFSGF